MCKRLSYNTGEVIWHSGDNMLVLPSDKLHVAGQRGFTSRGSPSRSFFGAMACLSGRRKFVGFAAIEEVKSRNGRIIAVATEGDTQLEKLVEEVLYVPATLPLLSPLLTAIPLQLMAYHAALIRGHDVDKPRNLAKSVTVE